VDFVGVLAGGRFVAFDAKSTRDVHGWWFSVSARRVTLVPLRGMLQ
jgi:penicillin-binding protein-related factor A (putative recombinase)